MKLYIQKVELQIQNNGSFTLHTHKSEHECKKGTFLFDPLFLYLWGPSKCWKDQSHEKSTHLERPPKCHRRSLDWGAQSAPPPPSEIGLTGTNGIFFPIIIFISVVYLIFSFNPIPVGGLFQSGWGGGLLKPIAQQICCHFIMCRDNEFSFGYFSSWSFYHPLINSVFRFIFENFEKLSHEDTREM